MPPLRGVHKFSRTLTTLSPALYRQISRQLTTLPKNLKRPTRNARSGVVCQHANFDSVPVLEKACLIRPRNFSSSSSSTTMSVSTHESLTEVCTLAAPAAIGPYAQAIKVGDLLFCSGCIPLDPATMQVVEGGVEAQTQQALRNLKAVVEDGGSALGKVVKTTVFLKSMDDFVAVNSIYASVFGNHKPARSAVEVARLPKDVLVEIECIASLK